MSEPALNALSAKRVGQYLIDAGILTQEELAEALDRQKRMSRAGFHVLLGTILEEMGAIDRQSLEAIILRQRLDEGSVSLGSEVDWAPFRKGPNAATITHGHEENGRRESSVSTTDPGPNGLTSPYPIQQDPNHKRDLHEQNEQSSPQSDSPEGTHSSAAGTSIYPSPSQSTGGEMSLFKHEQTQVQTPGEQGLVIGSEQETELEEAWHQEANNAPSSDLPVQPWSESEHVVEQQTDSMARSPVGVQETHGESEESESEPVKAATAAPTSPPDDNFELSTSQVGSDTGTVVVPGEEHGFSFNRVPNGLEESEVSAAIAQLTKQVRLLETELQEAKEGLAHLDSLRRYGEQTIKVADTIAEEVHAEAEKQATAIRDRAQQEARKIILDAKSEHDQIVCGAGERAKQVAVEIGKNIEEHRKLNDQLVEMGEGLISASLTGHAE